MRESRVWNFTVKGNFVAAGRVDTRSRRIYIQLSILIQQGCTRIHTHTHELKSRGEMFVGLFIPAAIYSSCWSVKVAKPCVYLSTNKIPYTHGLLSIVIGIYCDSRSWRKNARKSRIFIWTEINQRFPFLDDFFFFFHWQENVCFIGNF